MAFGRFNPRRAQDAPIGAINVTPLVDVMLVLVVIFILAAPMLAASLRLQLPKADGAAPQGALARGDALLLEIGPGGEVRVQGRAGDDASARRHLEELGRSNPQAEIQLRADAAVPYGRVVQLMGWAHAAGLTRIAFMTEPAASAPKAGGR